MFVTEANVEEYLCDLRAENDFLNETSKHKS